MKAILFDLDGTLANSSAGIKETFRYTFKRCHLPIPNDNQLSTFIGPPLETTFSSFFTDGEQLQKALTIFREYYREKGVYQASLYPDIFLLLEKLQQNHALFITTSKNEAMAHVMAEELHISPFFKNIYGSLPHRYLKEDVIQACLLDEKIAKEEALIVGDTKFDMIGGKRAGITTLGVTWGFGLENDLKIHGADMICHQPLDIEKMLGIG